MPAKPKLIFRIECFVDHDKLGMVLWLLAGKVYDLTQQPVTNAKVTGGQVTARVPSGKMLDMFVEWVQKRKLRQVTPDMAREFVRELGRPEKSYSLVLKDAARAGFLKKVGDGFHTKWLVFGKPKRKSAARKTATKANGNSVTASA